MPSTPRTNLPEVTSESDEGFVDLIFHIQEHRSLADGSQVIRAAGLHKGRQLTFEVVLSPNWKRGSLGEDRQLVSYQGEVAYRSVGAESDAFLQVLDDLYGTQRTPLRMAAATLFTGITLEGDPGNLGKGLVAIKLFYEKSGEDAYAELYTNIDLKSGRVEVHEKDPEYRPQLVRALAEE